jgi:hypothetical protein
VEGEKRGSRDQATDLGLELAEDLLARGGEDILDGIRNGEVGI